MSIMLLIFAVLLFAHVIFLVFHNINISLEKLKSLHLMITEFALFETNTDLFERKLIEYGKIIIKNQIAKNLIKEGLDDETIKRITKLNQKEYEKLKQQCSK